MEAASENTQGKARRGRPRRISMECEMGFRGLYPELKSYRQITNKVYQSHALTLLWEDARFSWLCDREKMKGNRGAAFIGFKPGILAELGRIDNDDDIRTVALQLCEVRPKTKTAIALIRSWRVGREPKRSWLSLLVTLERVVNEYAETHRESPWDDIERALVNLLEEVRELKGDGTDSERRVIPA